MKQVDWQLAAETFRPANGCSACHLLVKIICFLVKASFLSFSVTNGKKRKKEMKESVHVFLFFAFSFFQFVTEKDGKTCFNAKK